MKNKIKVLAACLALSCLVLSGCGEDTTPDPKQSGKAAAHESHLKDITPVAYGNVQGLKLPKKSEITIIGKDNRSLFWKTVKAGANQAVRDLNKNLGYKGKNQIQLNYCGMVDGEDVEEQVNILDEEMARYPAALGISLTDEKACLTQFDLAAENDLPIVAVESGAEYPGIVATVGTDNVAAGREAARAMADATGEKGQILIFMEDGRSLATLNKEAGIKDALQSYYPDMAIADTFHPDELLERSQEEASEDDAEESEDAEKPVEETKDDQPEEEVPELTQEEMLTRIIKDHPDAAGIITSGEQITAQVLDILKATQGTQKVVAFDWSTKTKTAIQKNHMAASIVQNPFGMGYAAVVACVRAAEKSPNEARVNTGYTVVTKSNMSQKDIKSDLYKTE